MTAPHFSLRQLYNISRISCKAFRRHFRTYYNPRLSSRLISLRRVLAARGRSEVSSDRMEPLTAPSDGNSCADASGIVAAHQPRPGFDLGRFRQRPLVDLGPTLGRCGRDAPLADDPDIEGQQGLPAIRRVRPDDLVGR